MSKWVDVRSFDDLMCDYQKSSRDHRIMPGLGTYFTHLIDQNKTIIDLLNNIDDTLRNCKE